MWSTCWLASVPVFLVLIRWWRETLFARAERIRNKSAFEKWLLDHRAGWKSFPAAMAGGVYLFALGTWSATRNWVTRFDVTRRVLAYLFRRELDKLGEERSVGELLPLPDGSFAKLGPEHGSPQWMPIDVDERLVEIVTRMHVGRGGLIALVGERGMGKSTALRRIHDQANEAMLLDMSLERAPDLANVLSARLQMPIGTPLSVAAAQLNDLEHGPGLLIDGADRFVEPVMGGLSPVR